MTYFFKNQLSNLRHLSTYALIALAIAGCTIKAGELPAETNTPTPVGIPVDAAVVKPEVLRDELVVTGTILANQQVNIVSELTRKVVSVHVKEGSKVSKGTLLFQLDNADLLAQLSRLRQQEKLALLNEKRLKDLLTNEAIPQQDYDEAETNLKVIQAQIQEMLTVVDKTRITAPFNGQIGMINTYPGAIVSTNTVLTDIEDNSIVKVEFSVPEKYTNILSIGSEQLFTTPADSEGQKTKIVAKAASLSTDTRTLLVRGITSNHHGKLYPGQSARITLALNTSENALTVPTNALVPSPGGYSVFVSRKGLAQPVGVEIGERNTGTVEIVNGLAAGDTLITSNILRLTPGTPIQFASVK
jgi:membrane fusion protein, multidrug efflux system